MAAKPKNKLKAGRHTTADDLCEAVIERVQDELRKKGLPHDRGNSVCVFLSRPMSGGLISGAILCDNLRNALKAKILDTFFETYGGDMPSALRVLKSNRANSKRAVASRQKDAETTRKSIKTEYAAAVANKKIAPHDRASIVAKKVNKTPAYVRQVINAEKNETNRG